jgi:hypothetical protein
LLWVLALNGIVIALQYIGVIGGYANGVYQPIISRPSGLTNGAYEVPMVIALIFAFLIGCKNKLSLDIVFIYLISISLIVMTASRIPFVAVNLIFLFYSFRFGTVHFKIIIVCVMAVISTFIVINSSSLVDNTVEQSFITRISQVLTTNTVQDLSIILDIAPEERNGVSGKELYETQLTLKTDQAKHEFLGREDLEADLSLLIRANKWIWATKTFINQNALIYLVGLAPGTLGNALDGGLLRIFIETGALGLITFIYFVLSRPKYKQNDPMLFVAITFLLGNLFIDYYLSYKVMALFLLLYGATARASNIRQRIR